MLASAAGAQETPIANGVIGPPQLKDFQIAPRERLVTQPGADTPSRPEPEPITIDAPPAPVTRPTTQPVTPAVREAAPARAEPTRTERAEPQPRPTAPTVEDLARIEPATPSAPPDSGTRDIAPTPIPAPAAVTAEEAGGVPPWAYALLAGLLAGAIILWRRRNREALAGSAALVRLAGPEPEPAPAPVAKPREALARPWIEVDLKASRAAATEEETTVDFTLTIRNNGKVPARNVRINARMFNAGAEQDKEIGLFFRTRGDGSRTFAIPEIQAGQEGLINGTVSMQRDQVRPISVQGRALFIPVVGVNTVYDWGEDQTGQTSKSYIIGQEPKQPADKMGPFRMDVGPRIWRTVGQRQHRLARRV